MLVLISRIYPNVPEYSHRAVSEPAFTMFTSNARYSQLFKLPDITDNYIHSRDCLTCRLLLYETVHLLSTGLLGIHK
jgi:hypothetical protein